MQQHNIITRIFLIGLRGCGKSHFGQNLAEKLNWVFIDSDQQIISFCQKNPDMFKHIKAEQVQTEQRQIGQRQHNSVRDVRDIKDIKDIIEQSSWDFFRDIESNLLKENIQQNKVVVATGGGVVLRPENRMLLQSQGFLQSQKQNLLQSQVLTIYLKASTQVLFERLQKIQNDKSRPALTNLNLQQEIELIAKERKSLYEQSADATINAEQSTELMLEEFFYDLIRRQSHCCRLASGTKRKN